MHHGSVPAGLDVLEVAVFNRLLSTMCLNEKLLLSVYMSADTLDVTYSGPEWTSLFMFYFHVSLFYFLISEDDSDTKLYMNFYIIILQLQVFVITNFHILQMPASEMLVVSVNYRSLVCACCHELHLQQILVCIYSTGLFNCVHAVT